MEFINGNKLVRLFIFIIGAALSVSFCAGRAAAQEAGQPASTSEIVDAAGKKTVIGETPRSIVSTAPAITEIIYYIGCEGALRGVTSLCDYPPEAKKKEIVGDLNLNYEKIIELKPDVVFTMKGLRAKETEVLDSFGIKSIQVDLGSIDSIFDSIDLIASVLKSRKNASELRRSHRNVKNEIKNLHKKALRSVYFEIWGDPPMSVGKPSFINDIISCAGAMNIFGNVDIENISVSSEKVIEKNPDFIVVAYPGKTSEVSLRPGYSELIAVRDGNVIEVDYNLYVRPGPRVIKGIFDLHNRLYPDHRLAEKDNFEK